MKASTKGMAGRDMGNVVKEFADLTGFFHCLAVNTE